MLLLFLFAAFAGVGGAMLRSVTEPVVHGEGPHWDGDRRVLYYVDISNQTVNKYSPDTGESRRVRIDGGPVSPIIPVEFEDEFVIGRGLDVVRFRWNGESVAPDRLRVLSSVDADKPGNRFNDGKVDGSGRLWIGTMGPEDPDIRLNRGSLYSFEPFDNFKPVKRLSPVSISNGLAWNANDTLMYYVDSPTRNIDVFDFDIIDGTLSNRRTLFSLAENDIAGVPDGMAIDENDNLWVAVYAGSSVIHVDTADGALLTAIRFPVTKVTSCAFGGARRDVLYVTTSRVGLSKAELEKQPEAGCVFEVSEIGVRGQVKPNKIRLFSSVGPAKSN